MASSEAQWTGPRSYRARKNRPCDACRKRKICCVKSSDVEPCTLCKMRSQQCTYLSKPNVRKRRNDGAQSQSPEETHSSRRGDEIDQASAVNDCHPDEVIISNHVVSEAWVSQFVGLSGDQDPYVLRHCHFSGDQYNSRSWSYLRVKSDLGDAPTHFAIVPDSHLDAFPKWYPTHPTVNIRSDDHRKLVHSYLSVVHASFPIVDPESLKMDEATICRPLLGAVYALAENFTPDISQSGAEDVYKWRIFLYQALPIEARHPRLETLEAGLLFIQRHPLIHRAPTTPGLWSEIGSLVGMSHDLGLNVDPSGWEIEQSQRSRRIRIAWALFTSDKWTALGLGRPSYISRDDWSVPMVREEDFADPSTPASAKAIFVAMSKLSVILAETLYQFYTIRAQQKIQRMSVDELMELLMGFEDQLDTFSRTVLDPLKSLASTDSILDSSGTVELAHHTLEIVIYRAILRHIPVEASHLVRQRARLSLVAAVEFLSGLQVSRLRAFWWSPISRINFAIIGSFMFSMRLTSIKEAEVEYWTAHIDRYRRLLELHSVGFEVTRLAARRLELLTCVAEDGQGPDENTVFDDPDFWNMNI